MSQHPSGQSGAAFSVSNSSPVTLRTLLITLFAGAGVVTVARQYEQGRMQEVMARTQEVAGKAAVGGPFSLTDQDGRPFTDQDLLGEFSLLYFGFTLCPDICPDELEKLATAVDSVQASTSRYILPVFISVDPARDTVPRVKEYVREFHPRLVGLTGDHEAVQRASKAYRVYFHKTDDSEDDYLVDHSIIMYLVNPEGDFVTFYGKNFTAEALAESISAHVTKWAATHPDYKAVKASNAAAAATPVAVKA